MEAVDKKILDKIKDYQKKIEEKNEIVKAAKAKKFEKQQNF